jgi:alpha-tubulin suppressor-like RCC1 family protein
MRFSLAAMIVTISCATGDETTVVVPRCIPGAAVSCGCSGGRSGVQVCGSTGTLEPCICGDRGAGPMPVDDVPAAADLQPSSDVSVPPDGDSNSQDVGVPRCVPGMSIICGCRDGRMGAQSCLPSGTYSQCECVVGMLDAGGSGIADAAATGASDSASLFDIAGDLGMQLLDAGSDSGTAPLDSGRGDAASLDVSAASDSIDPVDLGSVLDARVTDIAEDARPVTIARSIVASVEHSCAIIGDGRVRCWGRNASAQLGDGTGTDRDRPVDVLGLRGVVQIDAGYEHTCALTSSGQVYCWGDNERGQLGVGIAISSLTPVLVPGLTGVTQISAGWQHTCALRMSGAVLCWGINESGQLGDGSTTTRREPSPVVSLTDIAEVAAGSDSTCARSRTGSVWCWGNNSGGQLGDGTTSFRTSPTQISSLRTVTQLAIGQVFGCALTGTGEVHCWGSNSNAQLGDTSGMRRLSPVRVSLPFSPTSLAAGSEHVCATTVGGVVRCWGSANYGQLGAGTTSDSFSASFAPVTGLSGVVEVSCGRLHTCARNDLGNAWCWGPNSYGQLGDGTRRGRAVPVQVTW